MTERITQKDLERLVSDVNTATGSPQVPYGKNAVGSSVAFIGNYHLDYAYGGVKLVRMDSPGGGVKSISPHGYGPKRKLYDWMWAFLLGLKYKH